MISREELVTQSVMQYAKNEIFVVRGYSTDRVEFIDSWPYGVTELDRNTIAMGFNFDDEGEQAELGSDLKRRMYTISFIVFGKTGTYAKNLANVLKFAIDKDGTIPLLDISQTGMPEIDKLVVDGVHAEREIIPEPEPWQEYVWSTIAKIEDTYSASLV